MATRDGDLSSLMNENLGGWNDAMGLRFSTVTADEVVGQVVVAAQHLQPYGIVHGGVHCGLIEAACSTGAAAYALPRNQAVVGLENSTSFIKAARGGTLTIRARPIQRGRRTQVWEATVTDEQGQTLSSGRVRLLCLEPEAAIAGTKAELQPK